ncbi:porin [Serratia marcescens]|nr:porin [Serratia marcescens]
MGTHGAQRKTLALAVAGALLGTGFAMAPEAKAAGFIDDSTLTGGIYYWQRERDRKDLNPDSKDYNQYTTNLSHSTANLSLDFASGYAWDMFGLDVGAFTAIELAESSASGHPNEIAFSSKTVPTTKTIPVTKAA